MVRILGGSSEGGEGIMGGNIVEDIAGGHLRVLRISREVI